MDLPLIYRTKPVFGLDIGRTTAKVVQIRTQRGQAQVVGYSFAHFDKSATKDGEIVKPELIAATIKEMFAKALIGKINTRRVVASLPISQIYTRTLQLPPLAEKDLAEAVRLEAEQYVPLSPDDIYIEYRTLPAVKSKAPVKKGEELKPVLMVATPRKIVNSYLKLFEMLGLEAVLIEPNMFSNLRAIDYNCHFDGPKVVIDFGAQSSDMAIFDNIPLLVSTVSTGGDSITNTIASAFNLSEAQASQLKIRYGIGKSRWQVKLASALQPILSDFANEVQKMLRYYHEHNQKQQSISQIILVGGGANMPGLADFLSHLTGVQVQICNPWEKLVAKPLQPPVLTETTIYATAIGLALGGTIRD